MSITKREIVEYLQEINEIRKLNSGVAGEMISGLIADLERPPKLPEGWTWDHCELRCKDYDTRLLVMRNGNLSITSEGARVIVAQNIIRAALDLADSKEVPK